MNDLAKTALSVVAAGALGFAAWFMTPSTKAPPEFSDVGKVFYPSFTDPLAARALEVVGVDENTAAYKAFKVEHDGKRWVIPSHHNYPADAEQKMGQAAGSFIGLTKEQVVSDTASDHAAFGVVSPDDDKAPIKGRGVRFTIRGDGGTTLSDLIIGDEVKAGPVPEGGAPPSSGRRYVRIPGQNRVYAATIKAGVSPKFADWIETDLLQLKDAQVAKMEVYRGHVNEQTGKRDDSEHLTLARAPAPPPAQPGQPAPPANAWNVSAEPGGPPAEGEDVKPERVEEAITALKGLKIVGVRPKPANLAKVLGGAADAAGVKIGTTDVLNLQSKGFYLTQQGQLLANEGEETVACADGVTYTLWFGEIAAGEGDALSAGLDEPAKPEAKPADEKKPAGESRYLFVTVNFDEALLGPAPAPPPAKPASEPAADGAKPADPAAGADAPKPEGATPDASAAKEAVPDPAQEDYKKKAAERDAKVKAGKDRAAALSKRFSDWWYVIDATAFDKVRPTRADVIGPKEAATPPPPGGPQGPMMPPGPSTP